MEEYFKFEEIKNLDKVRFDKTKLKGHAKIGWKEVQIGRQRRGKSKICK